MDDFFKDSPFIHSFFLSIRSAELLAAYRPRCPILAVTRNGRVARQLHLHRGIFPIEFKGKGTYF